MTSPSSTAKRKATDRPISPPPVKRKVHSGTTSSAVNNFFKPASQKPKERTIWSQRGPNDDSPPTLLVGRYEPEDSKTEKPGSRWKIAAFDLDSTLITTASGKKHGNEATDWKWWHHSVPGRLRKLYQEEGYQVVVLSNQAGLTIHFDAKYNGPKAKAQQRVTAFKQKVNAVLANLDIPTTVYAATGHDIYRKPRVGMWTELCDDYDLTQNTVDLENSFFIGDAGGRTATVKTGEGTTATAKDFSCSDRNFAHNVGGLKFQTPEEYFLGEAPRDFVREFDLATFERGTDEEQAVVFDKPEGKQEVVVFCAPPGGGKSTFFWRHLGPLGYERINQDILKTREKCVKVAGEHLAGGKSIVIDNTNADVATRAVWIDLAKKHKVTARCVWLKTPLVVCQHNNAARALNERLNPEKREILPGVAFQSFKSRFKEPTTKEGFEEVIPVDFRFRGTDEEYGVWGRYWA